MHNYRTILLLLMAIFSVSACMNSDDIFGVNTFKKISLVDLLLSKSPPILITETELVPLKSNSLLVQAVMESPSTARSVAAAQAAYAQILITKTQKSSKVDISGATGLNADPWPLSGNTVLPAASASITARQLLSDNGQTDRSISLSQLAANAAFLEVEVAVDQTLKALIEANDIKTASENQIIIIDEGLDLYNSYEELVLAAVQAGVLSKSDELELRSLRNGTLSDRTNAVLASNTADGYLKTILKLHYKEVMLDLAAIHGSNISPTFSLQNSPKKKLLDLRSEQLNLEIEIQRSRNKPTSNLRTSLSSPTSRGANTTFYGGVTIAFPVRDGGAAAAQIKALSKELEVTEFDQQALIQEIIVAEKNWAEFLKYYLLQNELLKERVVISDQSVEELKLKLKAGRADVSKLAREILSKAQSEIALVNLKARYLREKVNAESVTGQTCRLFSLCDTIKNSLPTN